jgi:ankyrin repeat protein
MLLEHNANVSAERTVIATTPGMVQNPSPNGETPLHLAAKKGRAMVVQALLEAKAQVRCLDQVLL